MYVIIFQKNLLQLYHMKSKTITTTKKTILSKYTKSEIAWGFLVGVQCVVAFSVIVYHIV